MTTSRAAINVSGPAEPETVRIFRAVASSLGSRAGMTIEAIDEFKIAVDEAATLLLRSEGSSRLALGLTLEENGAGIRTFVSTDGSTQDWPDERTSAWPLHVIRQLARDATVHTDDEHPGVSFTMKAAR